MDDSQGEPVKVFVRIRPEEVDDTPCLTVFENGIRLMAPDGTYNGRKSVAAVDDKVFSFDHVFTDRASQEEVYEKVSSHAKAVIRGYNTTIFAYGSTGSGKSHTMTGSSAQPGIIPRVISDIFSIIEATTSSEKDVMFYVRISYVELYNNVFRNLLDYDETSFARRSSVFGSSFDSSQTKSAAKPTYEKIEVRESKAAGVFLSGGNNLRVPVTSAQDAFQLISKGNKYRATGSTLCNDVSSRSHAVLTIHVESRISGGGNKLNESTSSLKSLFESIDDPYSTANSSSELRLGKMHLVDLAGSERLGLSGAEGETLAETQAINLSLTALGDVLSALSKNATILQQQAKLNTSFSSTGPASVGRRSSSVLNPSQRGSMTMSGTVGTQNLVPVPYRNSKLTHLLKDSLGGNSKTIMITNIRALIEYFPQTSISLQYASRAKKIQNRVAINRDVIGDTGIHAVTGEIERLKKRLEERTMEFDRLRNLHVKESSENSNLKSKLMEMSVANENEKKQLENQLSQIIHSQAGQLEAQKKKLSSLQDSLQQELTLSQNVIAEQDREIKFLKNALEETSSEVKQQSNEQLQRMQRVIDAWQTQASRAQDELLHSMQKAEELRSTNLQLTQQLHSVRESQQGMCDELAERGAEIAMYNKKEATLQNELMLKSEELVNVLAQKQILESQMHSASSAQSTLTAEREAAVASLAKKDSEIQALKQSLAKANEKISQLGTEKSEMETKLKEKLKAHEEKSTLALNNAMQRLRETEEKLVKVDKSEKSSTRELQDLKNKLVEIQSKTEYVFKQKDAMIAGLNANVKALQDSLDKSMFVNKQSDEKNAELAEQCGDLKNKLIMKDRELLAKSENFLQQLEQRADEVKQLQSSHKAAVDKMRAKYEAEILDNHARFTLELTAKHDAKTIDIQNEADRKQQEFVDAMQAKHFDELRALQSDMDLQLVQLEHDRKAKLFESLAAQKLTLDREHETALSNMQDEIVTLNSNWLSKIRTLETNHAAEVEVINNKLSSQVKAYEHEKAMREMEHQNQLDILKREYLRNSDSKVQDLMNEMEEMKLRTEIEYNAKLEHLKEQHMLEMEECRADLKEEMKASVALNKTKYETAFAVKVKDLETKHEEIEADLRHALKEMQVKHEEELKSAVDAQVKQMSEAHMVEMDILSQKFALLQHAGEEAARISAETQVSAAKEVDKLLNEKLEEQRIILMSELEKEKDTELNRVKESFTESRRLLEIDHKNALRKLETNLREEFEVKLKELEAVNESKVVFVTEKLKIESSTALSESISAAVARANHEAAERECKALNEQKKTLEDQFASRLEEEMKVSLAKSTRELQVQHDETVKSLAADYERKIDKVHSDLEVLYNDRIAAKLAEERDSWSVKENAHANKLEEELTLKHKSEINGLLEKLEATKRLLSEQQAQYAILVEEAHARESHQKLEISNLKEEIEELSTEHSKSISKLKEELKNYRISVEEERESLKVAQRQEYAKREADSLKEAEEALKSAHRSEINILNAEHNLKLEQLKAEFQEKLDDIEAEKREIKEHLRKEKDSLHSEISQYESQVNNLKNSNQREKHHFEERLSELTEQMDHDHKEHIKSLTRSHAMEVEMLMKELKSTEHSWAEKSRLMEIRHVEEMSNVESDHVVKNARELARLESELKRYHEIELADTTHQWKREIEVLERAKKALQDTVDENRVKLDESQETILNLEEKLHSLKKEYADSLDEEISQLEHVHRVMLQSIKDQHAQEAALWQAEKERASKRTEEGLQLMKAAVTIECEEASRLALNKLSEKHAIEVQELISKHKAIESELRDTADGVRSIISFKEAQFDKDIQALRDEISVLNDNSNRTLREMQQNHSNELRDLNLKYSENLDKLLSARDKQHADEVDNLHRELKERMDLHFYECSELSTQHQNTINSMKAAHEQIVEQLKDKVAELEGEHKRVVDGNESEVKLLKNKYDTEISNLKDSHANAVDSLLDRLTREKETSVRNVQDEFDRNKQRWEAELLLERSRAEQLNSEKESMLTSLRENITKLNEDHVLRERLWNEQHQHAMQKARSEFEQSSNQWKAFNAQLELALQQANKQYSDVREDNHQLHLAHQNQIIEMNRSYDNRMREVVLEHNNVIRSIESDHRDALAAWMATDNESKRIIEQLNSQILSKERDLQELQIRLNAKSDSMLKMQSELDGVSEDVAKLHTATQAREEEYVKKIIPNIVERERKAAEDPWKVQVEVLVGRQDELIAKQNDLMSENASLVRYLSQAKEEIKRLDNLKTENERMIEQMGAQNKENIKGYLAKQHVDLMSTYADTLQEQMEAFKFALGRFVDKLRRQKEASSIFQLPGDKNKNSINVAVFDDLYNYFVEVVNAMPNNWKDKYGTFPDKFNETIDVSDPQFNAVVGSVSDYIREIQDIFKVNVKMPPPLSPTRSAKTPIQVLLKAEEHRGEWVLDQQHLHEQFLRSHGRSVELKTNTEVDRSAELKATAIVGDSKTSPVDQLISAVLDGDVQGIRAVIRSHGDGSLTCPFWKNLTKSIFPMHRAISGLHFHGNEALLLSSLEALIGLGGNVNDVDHAGNSVLQKAIQVCTSKSIVAVVQLLTKHDCDVNHRNREGNTALLCECKRVRTASAEVISMLVAAGADVNGLSKDLPTPLSPLELILLRGVASVNANSEVSVGVESESAAWDRSSIIDDASGENFPENSANPERRTMKKIADHDRSSGRNVWIRAAGVLLSLGARWNGKAKITPDKCSELHLLFAAFPPSSEDVDGYSNLIKSAIYSNTDEDPIFSPNLVEDANKRSALHVLCDRMSHVSADLCPDAPRIMKLVVGACVTNSNGTVIASADRFGKTVFDIPENRVRSGGSETSKSCLAVSIHVLRDASISSRKKSSSLADSMAQYRKVLRSSSSLN